MNAESANNNHQAASTTRVITPMLMAGLITALVGSVLLSLYLIVVLSGYDDSKRQADEAEIRVTKQRTEFSALQVEVESLTKRKDVLAPTVADWEKRLKEMQEAKATADSLNAKQHQAESDLAQTVKRLADTRSAVLEADKQKTDLTTTVERLNTERDILTKSVADARAVTRQAEDSERRLSTATNALASVDGRRKLLEADVSAAQTRFDQIQKQSDDLRQASEGLNTELASLRQQVQTQKDQLAKSVQKAAELKALNTALQQGEEKLAKSREQLTTVESRATEMESRLRQASSELAQLTNRVEQARRDAADSEGKRDTAKAELQRITQELAAAQQLLVETQTSQNQRARENAVLVAQVTASKKELEQARKDGADAEVRLDTARSGLQKADSELAAARAQLQVFVVKQGELTRESSGVEATIVRLKSEKAALEKEIGRLGAQLPKVPPDGQK
jgi:chromosome segregation ATPase